MGRCAGTWSCGRIPARSAAIIHTAGSILSMRFLTGTKAAQDKAADQDEKAFEMVGRGAPQGVKDAWMDAAKEVNANGMGIRGNGMMSHISQMMVQRLNKQLRGETENFDILGNTVESAIQATKQALYDLEHPVVYTPRSIEVQQARIKEGEFYRAFLEKLERL